MASKYFYKNVDITTLISTQSAYDASFITISNVQSKYIGFPNISRVPINNLQMDKSLTVVSNYLLNGIDISGILPSKAFFYRPNQSKEGIQFFSTYETDNTAPWYLRHYDVPVNQSSTSWITANTALNTDVSGTTQLDTAANYIFTVPNIVNSIGVFLVGGGGGGASNINNNSGGAGGGGGKFIADRVDVNIVGRTFNLTIGGGGAAELGGFINSGLRVGNKVFGSNGEDTILSTGNTPNNPIMRANKGMKGSNNTGGLGGTGATNLTVNTGLPNGTRYNTSTSAGAGANGGFAPDAFSTDGGNVPTYQGKGDDSFMTGYSNYINTNYAGTNASNNKAALLPSATAANYSNNTVLTNSVFGLSRVGGSVNTLTYDYPYVQNTERIIYRRGPNGYNYYGGGGGGSSSCNGGRPQNFGAPGYGGCAVIYYYL
jgi:hypothetical protein